MSFGKTPNTAIALLELSKLSEAAYFVEGPSVLSLALAIGSEAESALAGLFKRQRRPLPTLDDLAELHGSAVHTSRTDPLLDRIMAGQDVCLIGQSSSGKTTTAFQVALHLSRKDWTYSWIDLSEPAQDAYDLLLSLVRTASGSAGRHLVVIDDLQADPGAARRVAGVLRQVREMTSGGLSYLTLGWESAKPLVEELFVGATRLACNGDEIVPSMAHGLLSGSVDAGIIGKVRERSAGDLLIARLLLEFIRDNGVFPNQSELGERASQTARFRDALTPSEAGLLYRLAALSQFEIDAERRYVDAISEGAVDDLVGRRAVRLNGDYLTLGHRSLARVLLSHLVRKYPNLSDLPNPTSVAVEYLRGAGSQQVVSALERLDLAGLAAKQGDQHGTAFLARAWESVRILVNYLARQSEVDKTWGDNLPSTIFAAQAFAEIGHDEGWSRCEEYVRSRWDYGDGRLPSPRGSSSSERIDFEEIRKRMVEATASPVGSADEASEVLGIDFDLMHRTWVLGLLLGFEGSARKPRATVVAGLREAAESAQDLDGAFYPPRVPWVTARVLLGLASIGDSVRSSDTVRRACDWLRRPAPHGPYRLGAWESGTGTWNTPLMTTAMSVLALLHCGISTTDPVVRAGVAYLLSCRGEWLRPGREIDGAFAMEATLLVRGRWRDIEDELGYLLSWAKKREAWSDVNLTAADSQTESSKVPFMASALIGIVWGTVRSELPLLLEDLTPLDLAVDEESNRRASLQRALRSACNEIRETISNNVRDRSVVLQEDLNGGTKSRIAAELNRWRDHEGVLIQLETQLSDPAIRLDNLTKLAAEVDALGEACVGIGWRKSGDRDNAP